MVDGGGGAAFPVIFYDGEREINIGDIRVQPMLEFKTFQMMISQKIGISPNQISIYLVHHSSLAEERRKTPITGKVNFALIIRQKDCFFLVVLKRSRKSRNRKLRPNGVDFCDYLSDNDFLPSPPPENVVLLRRNQAEVNMNGLQLNCFGKPFYDQITQVELAGLNDRLQNLKVQREKYGIPAPQPVNFSGPSLAPRPMPPDLNPSLDPGSFPRIQETMTRNVKESSTSASNKVACEECVNAKKAGCTAPFHPCVNDPLIPRFLTRAGPIARPVKSPR
ncbi:unnamed protein product [Coffea canephora]|uniref:DUF7138 domain-containing protein n=1 Tax=Coffea canephora TaxID=49390 RepID=A0A068UQ97_COFCA|nr:unnamed protein product [Coffea canephora]